MRTCLRCGCEMKENCDIRVEGAGYGVVLSQDAGKLFGGRIGKPRVAICPQCGEVSIYLPDTSVLKKDGGGVRRHPEHGGLPPGKAMRFSPRSRGEGPPFFVGAAFRAAFELPPGSDRPADVRPGRRTAAYLLTYNLKL